MRALAVLSVFVFHLNHAWLPGGFLGVDVFFVISGYLITSIIFKECGDGSFHLTKFYQRRIARIFPAFFAVALATLAGARFIYLPQDLASAGANLAAAALSVTNLKLMFQGNYFAVSPDAQPYLHYWTLSVEEQFYVFFPLLLLLIFKYARRHLVRVLAALAVLSFATAVLIAPWRPVWAFYLLPTRAWELLAGCLLAVTTDPARPAPEARWRNWLTGFGLAVILLSMAFIGERARHPEFWMLLPVAGAVFDALARCAIEDGVATGPAGQGGLAMLLVGLAMGEGAQPSVLAVALSRTAAADLMGAGNLLRLAADTPFLYQRQQLLNTEGRCCTGGCRGRRRSSSCCCVGSLQTAPRCSR